MEKNPLEDLGNKIVKNAPKEDIINHAEDLKSKIGDRNIKFMDLSSDIKEIPEDLRKEVMEELIDNGYTRTVAQNLSGIPGLDKNFAFKLIDADQGVIPVAFYLEYFEDLKIEDHQEIAERLLEKGKASSLADTLGQFKGLNSDIKNGLKEAGLERIVEDNPNSFEVV